MKCVFFVLSAVVGPVGALLFRFGSEKKYVKSVASRLKCFMLSAPCAV